MGIKTKYGLYIGGSCMMKHEPGGISFEIARAVERWQTALRAPNQWFILSNQVSLESDTSRPHAPTRCRSRGISLLGSEPAWWNIIWTIILYITWDVRRLHWISWPRMRTFCEHRSTNCATVIMQRDGKFQKQLPHINSGLVHRLRSAWRSPFSTRIYVPLTLPSVTLDIFYGLAASCNSVLCCSVCWDFSLTL